VRLHLFPLSLALSLFSLSLSLSLSHRVLTSPAYRRSPSSLPALLPAIRNYGGARYTRDYAQPRYDYYMRGDREKGAERGRERERERERGRERERERERKKKRDRGIRASTDSSYVRTSGDYPINRSRREKLIRSV